MANRRENKTVRDLFSWAPKSLQMVTAAMKLKTLTPWKKSYDQHRQHTKKQRHYFANKGPSSHSYGFPSSLTRLSFRLAELIDGDRNQKTVLPWRAWEYRFTKTG